MGEVEATRPAGCAVWMTSAVAACALVAGCQPSELELPPVKTPLGVHLACQPPQPSPSPFLRPAPVPGSSCGLGDPECDEVRTLVVQVDEHGRVTGAYLRGRRSPELDGCILGEVRATAGSSDQLASATGTQSPENTLPSRHRLRIQMPRKSRAAEQADAADEAQGGTPYGKLRCRPVPPPAGWTGAPLRS